MIVLVRLEADAATLDEVVKDIDAAAKSLKLGKELQVHDEHYERVNPLAIDGFTNGYRGRRVYKVGAPGAKQRGATYWGGVQQTGTTSSITGQVASLAYQNPSPKKR